MLSPFLFTLLVITRKLREPKEPQVRTIMRYGTGSVVKPHPERSRRAAIRNVACNLAKPASNLLQYYYSRRLLPRAKGWLRRAKDSA